MANPVVGIDVVARLDGLRKQLAEIPPIGGKAAKDLTAQLSKEIKSLEAATRKASAPTKDLRKEVSGFTTAAGDAGAGAKKLRGLFGLLGEDASSALGFIDDLGDGVEVFGGVAGMGAASAGLLTGAVAALGAVYLSTTAEIKRAEETEASLKRTHESLIPSERALRDIRLELAVATKTLTEAEAKQEAARNAASDAVSDYAKGQQTEREELRKSTESAQMWIDTMDRVGLIDPLGMKQRIADWTGLSDTIAQNEVRTKALDGALVEQHDIQKDVRESTIEMIKEDEKAAKAKDRATAATERLRKETELLRQQSEEMQAVNDASATATERYQAGLQKLRDVENKSLGESGSALAKLNAEQTAAKEAAAEIARKAIEGITLTASAEEEITRQLRDTQAAIDKEYFDKRSKLMEDGVREAKEAAEKEAEAAKKAAAKQIAIRQGYLSAANGITEAVADFAGMMSDRMAEHDKEAAMEWWRVQKVAAIADATLNTALAISEASHATPYPPVNAALMVAAGLVGAGAAAAVAAQPPPSFGDTAGVHQMVSGGTVGLASGDYFAAAKDPADLQRQVNGATDPFADRVTGGGQYTVIGSRAYGRFFSDNVRLNGPLSRQFTQTRSAPLGRRRS